MKKKTAAGLILIIVATVCTLHTSCRFAESVMELIKADDAPGGGVADGNGGTSGGENSGGGSSGGSGASGGGGVGGTSSGGVETDDDLAELLAQGNVGKILDTPVTGAIFTARVVPRLIRMAERNVKFERIDHSGSGGAAAEGGGGNDNTHERWTEVHRAPVPEEYGRGEDSQTVYLIITDGNFPYQEAAGLTTYAGGEYEFWFDAPEYSVDADSIGIERNAENVPNRLHLKDRQIIEMYVRKDMGKTGIEARLIGVEIENMEAKNSLFDTGEVTVMLDSRAGYVDDSGRLLCYVKKETEDKKLDTTRNVMLLMSGKGWYSDTPPYNETLMKSFRQAEAKAKEWGYGMWKSGHGTLD